MIENFLSENNCIISNKIVKPNVTPPAPVTPPVSSYITFVDPIVKQICVENWGSNGEITDIQAAAVTDLGTVFVNNTDITSFNELQYFTGLTTLKNNAFTRCTNLSSITLPSSITTLENGIMAQSIEESYGCFLSSGLTAITIPESVTSIGDIAFALCPNITSLTIPETIINIGEAAFVITGLTTITANSKIPCSIQNSTFGNCANLTNIYVPAESVDTYKTAEGWSWSEYVSIIKAQISPTTPITFADPVVKQICVENWGSNGEITYEQAAAVTSLRGEFTSNTQITSFNELQYFTGLTSINFYSFKDCSNLTSVVIPESVLSIAEHAFYGCNSLTSVTIPNSVTYIGPLAFISCSSLTSITIPNSVSRIDYQAFQGTGLTSIRIPNSVSAIGNRAFLDCTALTSIIIGNSLTKLNYQILANCTSLTAINIAVETPPSFVAADFPFYNTPNLANIFVPTGTVDTYKAATGWSNYANIILEELPPPK